MIFFNDSHWNTPQTRIRFESCTKNWNKRHSDFTLLLSLSPLLQLILGLLRWHTGTHGRKGNNHDQTRQVARKELHQGTNYYKKVL